MWENDRTDAAGDTLWGNEAVGSSDDHHCNGSGGPGGRSTVVFFAEQPTTVRVQGGCQL